jgi:hypothetical protein
MRGTYIVKDKKPDIKKLILADMKTNLMPDLVLYEYEQLDDPKCNFGVNFRSACCRRRL